MSKKKLAFIIIPLAILIVAIGLFTGWYMSRKTTTPPTSSDITVPSIIGLTEADAKKAVEAKGLKFSVVSREKSDKPKGTVFACSPDEGKTIKASEEVRVYISTGTSPLTIPDLKDIDITSATDMIQNNGFQIGKTDHQFNDTVPKDTIISQKPEADSPASKGDKIDLVISNGPEIKYTIVPDLKDATIDQAEALLKNANLKMGSQIVIPTDKPELNGKIANQTPTAKSQIKQGMVVDISYYSYTEAGA